MLCQREVGGGDMQGRTKKHNADQVGFLAWRICGGNDCARDVRLRTGMLTNIRRHEMEKIK